MKKRGIKNPIMCLVNKIKNNKLNIKEIPRLNVAIFKINDELRIISFNNRRLWIYNVLAMYGVFENTKKIPVHIMNCDEFESFMYNLYVPCFINSGCFIPGIKFEDVIIRSEGKKFNLQNFLKKNI